MMQESDNVSIYEKIRCNPKYQELVRRRNSFQLLMTLLVLVGFYAFIFIVAFQPAWLAKPVSQGAATSIGIYVGVGLMIAFWILTGIYIYRANHVFDVLNDELIQNYRKESHL
jgi:uncharacterized membrane protein (DUF485 family)